jgi:hypothetical protein
LSTSRKRRAPKKGGREARRAKPLALPKRPRPRPERPRRSSRVSSIARSALGLPSRRADYRLLERGAWRFDHALAPACSRIGRPPRGARPARHGRQSLKFAGRLQYVSYIRQSPRWAALFTFPIDINALAENSDQIDGIALTAP